MKRKFLALCSTVIALSVCFAVFSVDARTENNVTTATAKVFYAEKIEETETTNSSLGNLVGDVVGGIGSGSSDGIGDILGGIGSDSSGGVGDALGGIGDSFGGIGDALGGIGGGLGDIFGGLLGDSSRDTTAAPVATTSADVGLIIPVPAATQTTSETVTTTEATEAQTVGETVDYAATSNPYTKPTGTFVAGDEDETIKWLQWIFIYTHYGLNDNGITGVLDEDTVAVVKKLQHENELTVDGNITGDVIKAAEVLYYQAILGDDVSAIEVSSDNTTGEPVSSQTPVSGEEKSAPVALLIVVLVIIWVLAIGGIVLLFIFKKKKLSAQKAAEGMQTSATQAQENSQIEKEENKSGISSLSDLFEEADKNNK